MSHRELAQRARSTGYYQAQRRRARQRDGNRCRRCDSTRNLEVHHIDNNPTNHTLSKPTDAVP